ncbi:trigger factor [Gordonibacter sp. 28C]|nr:trigger factor [Gordonibacter sp. 28C]
MMEDSYVETKVEALQDNRVKVTVTVDAKDIDARIKKTYKDFAHKYNFPGFRAGKAPRPIIDNALGAAAVPAAVTDDVVNETYPLAIDGSNLYPVAKPAFDENMGLVEAGKPFEYSLEVEVKPELELSSYEPVEIEMPAEGVSDAEIDDQIDQLREHYYDYEDAAAATKVKEDSYLDLSIKATDDAGEDIASMNTPSRLYGLGTGLFPAEFDAELVGMKKGQKKEFSIDVPAEPTVMTQPLMGKTTKINFEVEVVSVKNKALPEVTDEWAKDTLGFEDVADLRNRVAESIAEQKADVLPRIKENQCLSQLADRLQGEAPEAMCEEAETSLLQDFFQQLQRQGMSFDAYLAQQGIKPDQFKDDVKAQAADMTKQDLALDAWARHFGMEVTDEDVAEEFVKSGVEDPKKLQEEWRKNGQLHMVKNGIARTRAAQDVMEKAVVTEIEPGKASDEKKKPAKKAAAKKTAKKDEAKADAAAEPEATEKKPAKKAAPKKAKKDEAAEAEKAADAE